MTNRTFVMACLTPLFIFSLGVSCASANPVVPSLRREVMRLGHLSRYCAQAAVLKHTGSDRACVTGDNVCGSGCVDHRGHVPCSQPISWAWNVAGRADLATGLPRRGYRISHHPFGRSPRAW